MDWVNQIGGMLQKYSGTESAHAGTEAEFDQVASQAPPNVVANGLAEAFRSDATPAFPQMLSQIFGNSTGDQKASVLNSLVAALGPAALAGILGQSRGGGLGNLSSTLTQGGQITPQQASQIPPEALQQIAASAQQKDPGIIDQLSNMYAQTPGIVKTLGAGALAVALAKIAKDHKPI